MSHLRPLAGCHWVLWGCGSGGQLTRFAHGGSHHLPALSPHSPAWSQLARKVSSEAYQRRRTQEPRLCCKPEGRPRSTRSALCFSSGGACGLAFPSSASSLAARDTGAKRHLHLAEQEVLLGSKLLGESEPSQALQDQVGGGELGRPPSSGHCPNVISAGGLLLLSCTAPSPAPMFVYTGLT